MSIPKLLKSVSIVPSIPRILQIEGETKVMHSIGHEEYMITHWLSAISVTMRGIKMKQAAPDSPVQKRAAQTYHTSCA